MSGREIKEREASAQGALVRDLIAHFASDHLIGRKIKNGDFRKKMVEPPWSVPNGFLLSEISMDNFRMEWLQSKESCSDKALLQLHGGGYIGAMRNAYRNFAVTYSSLGNGMPVLTADYRVAPQDPFPAALEDAYASYRWLLENGYQGEQIFLAGDSAGGGLALALAMCLRDRGEPMPCGIIAMSPWTDMTASGESYQKNFENDPLFGGTEDSMIYNRDYAGEEDLTNPYLSPLFGDYEGFPPMLIQAGSCEMLLSDSVSLANKAKEAGVKVRLSVYDGMFHVFQMAPLALPECKRAWMEIGRFIEEIDGEGAQKPGVRADAKEAPGGDGAQ